MFVRCLWLTLWRYYCNFVFFPYPSYFLSYCCIVFNMFCLFGLDVVVVRYSYVDHICRYSYFYLFSVIVRCLYVLCDLAIIWRILIKSYVVLLLLQPLYEYCRWFLVQFIFEYLCECVHILTIALRWLGNYKLVNVMPVTNWHDDWYYVLPFLVSIALLVSLQIRNRIL